MMIHPGLDEAQIILPPGSIDMPLKKCISGRPGLVIDEYVNAVEKAEGGVARPAPTPTTHNAPRPLRASLPATVVGSAAVEGCDRTTGKDSRNCTSRKAHV